MFIVAASILHTMSISWPSSAKGKADDVEFMDSLFPQVSFLLFHVDVMTNGYLTGFRVHFHARSNRDRQEPNS
jgi:hypothetical protein